MRSDSMSGLVTVMGLLLLNACGDDTGGGSGGSGTTSSTAPATSTSTSTGTATSTSTTNTSTSTTSSTGQGGAGEGGHGEGGHDEDDAVEAHACVHLDQGPFEPLMATASAEGAPLLEQLHIAYEITLQEAGGGQHDGFVAFTADEGAEFYFFADEDVPIEFLDGEGNPLAIEATCEATPCSAVCDVILAKYKLDLEPGTVALSIGPTAAHDFHLLVEEGHHNH